VLVANTLIVRTPLALVLHAAHPHSQPRIEDVEAGRHSGEGRGKIPGGTPNDLIEPEEEIGVQIVGPTGSCAPCL